jgi:hypothetical protein
MFNLKQIISGDSEPSDLFEFPFGSNIQFNKYSNVLAISSAEPFSESNNCYVKLYNKNISGYSLKQCLSGNVSLSNSNEFIYINDNGSIIAIPDNNGVIIYTGSSLLNWNFKQRISFGDKRITSIDGAQHGDILIFGSIDNLVSIYTGNLNSTYRKVDDLMRASNNSYAAAVDSNFDASIIIVGQPSRSESVPGLAFIYTGNQNHPWRLKQTLSGNNLNIVDFFGKSLDSNQNSEVITIGAPNINTVFIYTGDKNKNWTLKQKITGNNFFGNKVKIDNNGNTLFISNLLDIKIYEGNKEDGWNFLQTISGQNQNINNTNYTLGVQSNNNVLIYNKDCIFNSYTTNNTNIVLKNQFREIIDINDSWDKNREKFQSYNYTGIFDSKDTAGTILSIKNNNEYFVTAALNNNSVFSAIDTGFSGYTTYFTDYSTKNNYDVDTNFNKIKQQIIIKQFKYENTGYQVTFANDKAVASYNLSGLMNAENAFSWNIKFLENKTFSGAFLYLDIINDPSLNPIDIYKLGIPPRLEKQLVNYFESFQTVCQFKLNCDAEIPEILEKIDINCWTGTSLEGRDFNNWLQENLQRTVDVLLTNEPRKAENLLESVGVELYFTTLSGYILYNNWITGEQIIWDLYNFDYPKTYRTWHLNNNPPYPSTGFIMTYPFDWDSMDSLISGLNKRLNSPISYPVWYPYPCTSGEISGVFIEGPLMRFWKNTGTTGDGLPLSHVNNRIDFVSLRNLPQVTVKNEFLTRKNELFKEVGIGGIETGKAIASTTSIIDTSFKFVFNIFDADSRKPRAFGGFRYLLPKYIVLEGLNKSSNLWEDLDQIDFEPTYKNLAFEASRIIVTLTGLAEGVLTENDILEFEDTGKVDFDIDDVDSQVTCIYRDLFEFRRVEQFAISDNIYCPFGEQPTLVKFVWPESCPPYIISGSQVIEVDNVYWCNLSKTKVQGINCEEPFKIYCPPGFEESFCTGPCLEGGDTPCSYWTCRLTGILFDSVKYIPITYTIFQTGSTFSKNAGFNPVDNGNGDENLQLRCGEEIVFKGYKEFRVSLVNFFESKDPYTEQIKALSNFVPEWRALQIARDAGLAPLYLDDSFYVQNISFIDAKNVPFSGHVGEAECLIGSDYVVSVSGLTPLRFTGLYDVSITDQNSSGQYTFKNVMVGRKIEDEERFVKFNKVSGYINDESGFAFLRDTINGSGKICYTFDNTPYFFYDPITTIVSFEKTFCGDFFRTGILSGTETVIKQSVINKELLAGGRYNIPIDFYTVKEDGIVNGRLTNTPYRAYNITGIYNISGTATGIAENGVLNVNIPSFIRPFN